MSLLLIYEWNYRLYILESRCEGSDITFIPRSDNPSEAGNFSKGSKSERREST